MTIAVACGLIILALLVIMLLAGVPIAVALAVSSIGAILPVLDMGASVLTGAQRIFSGISVFSLLAIPFFILAGNLMNKGGIAIRLINFAKIFTGSIPGALAHTNAVANMLFGAISGSGTAAASAMGSIIGPIEEEEGYDRAFSAAANIATAPTGLLIPPSNVMITFSLVSGGTSVAALFMAGYIPGILWGLACMVVIYFFARKRGYRSTKRYTGSEKVKVFFSPFVAQPSIHMNAKANFFNIDMSTSYAEICYSVAEGVAFIHKHHIDFLRNAGLPVKEIRLTGGTAKSHVWNQIFANVLQVPIVGVDCEETGAQGVAIAAGIGAGVYKDYEDAFEKAVKVKEPVLPDDSTFPIYEKRYKEWCRLNEIMKTYWDEKSKG